ncbi:MAG: 5'/3'-nucleotidase SurE [Myxococcales bacterium]
MRILLTNDDGIHAEGLQALHDALAPLHEVWVVAPDREQSAASHAITLARPLRIKERKPRWFEVDGTPTDCVYIALNHVLKDQRPAVTCSGINDGPNVGNDVLYSGTVAAAVESAMIGVPGIALSHAGRSPRDFASAARFAPSLVEAVARHPLPRHALLNVNFPNVPTDQFAVTCLGTRNYGAVVHEKTDPRGRQYYWIGGGDVHYDDLEGSDCNAVFKAGLISLTPLSIDKTDHGLLGTLRTWDVQGFRRHG